MKLDRTRWLAIFFATTFVVGWAPVLFALANGHGVESRVGRAVLVFHAFGPLVGAAVCTVLAPRREAPLRSLGLSLEISMPLFVAWGLPLAMTFVALGVCALFGAPPLTTAEALARSIGAHGPAQGEPVAPLTLLLMALPAGLTLNLVPALATELGVRGFLYREMQGGFAARSLRIGLVEAAYFAPVAALGWAFPQHAAVGAVLVAARILTLSFVCTVLRTRGGSVLPVALFRSTGLALMHPSIDLVPSAPDWLRPPFGLSGLAACVVVLGAVLLHDRYFARRKLVFVGTHVGQTPT